MVRFALFNRNKKLNNDFPPSQSEAESLDGTFYLCDALEFGPRLLGKFLRREDVILQITEAYRQNDMASGQQYAAFMVFVYWDTRLGSVMESIYSGVPMIGWPFEVEQSTNCKIIVEDRNIGITFSKGKITEEKVQKAIEDLMRGSRGKVARNNVERLCHAAKKAQMKDGLSKGALKDFVNIWPALEVNERKMICPTFILIRA